MHTRYEDNDDDDDDEQQRRRPPGGWVPRRKRSYWPRGNNAVSPVIGVILMVAITVILSAVIATFVLGLGEQVSSTAPQASFTAEYNSTAGEVTVTHASGATIDSDQLKVNGQAWTSIKGLSSSTEVSAGDTATISASPGDTVRITWTSNQGTESATLQTYSVPE